MWVALLALSLAMVAVPARAVMNTVVSGVSAGIGIAADPAGSAVYYVEWNAGTLRRIALSPGCDTATPATCTVTTVASGFSHPQDVALDMAHNVAYVTTRDDVGTTGKFWRVDLGTGIPTLLTFNLGAPHQIALDVAANAAYVTGFSSGRLWKIDLDTGSKTTVASGLGNPIGVAIDSDRVYAYVTEQSPSRLSRIELATGVRTNVGTGLTSPFYLQWTDPSRTTLLMVQRDPANDVKRVDIPTSTVVATPAISGLPTRPSAIAINPVGSAAYVATETTITRVDLASIPVSETVFLAVGNVPATSIAGGYATTDPGYFLQVKNAPFGGTLNILGNLSWFSDLGATHYQVNVSKDGGPPEPLDVGWSAYRWNVSTLRYEITGVAPDPGTTRYAIPVEYVNDVPHRWIPAFLMMRWPSGDNGDYTFTVDLFDGAGNPVLIPSSVVNELTVKIDNTAAEVDLVSIHKHGVAAPLGACTIVNRPSPVPPGYEPRYDVKVTAYDPNGHMLSYGVYALWGDNQSGTVIPTVSYPGTPVFWPGVINHVGPPAGFLAGCNCAHTFIVSAWKRTIDGYGYLYHYQSHQSITINDTGVSCP